MKYIYLATFLSFSIPAFGMEASHAKKTEEQQYQALFQKYKTELEQSLAAKNKGGSKTYPRDACFDGMSTRYQQELATHTFSWGTAEEGFRPGSLSKEQYFQYLIMSNWIVGYKFIVNYDQIKKAEADFFKVASTNYARLFYPRGIVHNQKYIYEKACESVKLGAPWITNTTVPETVRNWINPWGFSLSLDKVVESYNSALCIQAYTNHLLNMYGQEGATSVPIERFSSYSTQLKLDPEVIRMCDLIFTTETMPDGIIIPVYKKRG